MTKKKHAIRKRSGEVNGKNKLQLFLYLLMRDELPPGTIEKIAQETETPEFNGHQYCNGWLAQYANDLAKRLEK